MQFFEVSIFPFSPDQSSYSDFEIHNDIGEYE